MHYATVHPTKGLLVNVATGDNRAARDVPAAQSFDQRDTVRLKIPMLESKHVADSPQTALYIVANEKCTVFSAQGLSGREEICGGRSSTFALYRCDDRGGDIAFRQFMLERGHDVQRNACVPYVHQRTKA